MALFVGATAQCLDSTGRTRVIIFEKWKTTLITSPLPPLDVKEIVYSDVTKSKIDNAMKFIEDKKLEIISQIIVDVSTIGLWVREKGTNTVITLYIPLEKSKPINGIDASEESDPFFTPTEPQLSSLTVMKANYKVAEYLKEYSIYVWSLDPAKFNESSFVVIKDYDYSLPTFTYTKFVIDDKSPFLRLGKIVVTDEKIIPRLINYVKVTAANNSKLQEIRQSTKTINPAPFFRSVDDFVSRKENVVFVGRDSMRKWGMNTKRVSVNTHIFYETRPNAQEPYFYVNSKIKKGRLCLIQNTITGDYPSALAVSASREPTISLKDSSRIIGVNSGYETVAVNPMEDNALKIFTADDGKNYSRKGIRPKLRLLGYEDGTYGALFFFDDNSISGGD